MVQYNAFPQRLQGRTEREAVSFPLENEWRLFGNALSLFLPPHSSPGVFRGARLETPLEIQLPELPTVG